MKTLNDYKDDAISALLDKYGAFFCFGSKQFEEKRKPEVKYTYCGAGLLVPSEHAHTVISGIIEIGDQAVEQDKQENGKEKIIERELFNHEAFYTNDISSTVEALQVYGYTQEDVWPIFVTLRKTVNYE